MLDPMLSYRHAFHAGNAADVLKHGALIFCLDYLGRKDAPYLCVDTHAGAGYYALDRGFAAQNREWEGGIGRLLDAAGEGTPPLARRCLGLLGGARRAEYEYPGSPALIRALLRPQDRGVFFELHPQDYALLEANMAGDSRLVLRREDGLSALKALLPPRSRRACVFIDPPYERLEEYALARAALSEGLRRFPSGLYIIWYPLLGGGGVKARSAGAGLMELYRGNRCRVELCTAPVRERGMYGSGLVIFNPPWTLKAALEEALPYFAGILGGGAGSWGLTWEG